jgi:parallel beta-helix repeat protein
MNSTSDDGINIKFSYIQILDSAFYNNFADQIDLDYSNGIVSGNKFYYSKPVMEGLSTDGLDISGSVMVIRNNIFEGMTDKGISVGESSNAIILENSFTENYSAIAVKDNSEVCIISNDYLRNIIDINPYVKKKMYDVPKLYLKEKSSLSINGSTLNDYKIYNELSPKCNDWLESISA